MRALIHRNKTWRALAGEFGIRSRDQLTADLSFVVKRFFRQEQFHVGLSSAGLVRPDLSLPAYDGRIPDGGVSPIYNFFDRTGGGKGFHTSVTRRHARDWRGGRLSYDEHDGTDFVCPPGTPVVVSAPGVLVAVRDTWLRGGITAMVDHGDGIVTHYTHLSLVLAQVGTSLARGEVVGLSGVSGLDLVLFFPWVPPHVHYMVWDCGRPVDPFAAPGEEPRCEWLKRNEPTSSGALPGERVPSIADVDNTVDEQALDKLMGQCASDPLKRELDSTGTLAGKAAICEDTLHHAPSQWRASGTRLRRPDVGSAKTALTLPLARGLYDRALPIDRWWTRPRG